MVSRVNNLEKLRKKGYYVVNSFRENTYEIGKLLLWKYIIVCSDLSRSFSGDCRSERFRKKLNFWSLAKNVYSNRRTSGGYHSMLHHPKSAPEASKLRHRTLLSCVAIPKQHIKNFIQSLKLKTKKFVSKSHQFEGISLLFGFLEHTSSNQFYCLCFAYTLTTIFSITKYSVFTAPHLSFHLYAVILSI